MKNYLKLLVVASAVFLSACAVGPLVSHETARTVGDSNHELVGGYGKPGYMLKWNYGVSQNFDIGFHFESLSVGLRAKYALRNGAEHQWSFAVAGGAGSSLGGTYYSGDLMASYLAGAWEPYATIRAVHIKTDPIEFRDKDTGNIDFTVTMPNYEYGQGIVGTRYWFNPHWIFSAEFSGLFPISKDLHVQSGVIASGALGYRF